MWYAEEVEPDRDLMVEYWNGALSEGYVNWVIILCLGDCHHVEDDWY